MNGSLSEWVDESGDKPWARSYRWLRSLAVVAKAGPSRVGALVDKSYVEEMDLDELNVTELSVDSVDHSGLSNVDSDGETWTMKVIDNGVLEFTKESDQSKLYLQGSVTNPDP